MSEQFSDTIYSFHQGFEKAVFCAPGEFKEENFLTFLESVLASGLSHDLKKDLMGYFLVMCALVKNDSLHVMLRPEFQDYVSALSCDAASETALAAAIKQNNLAAAETLLTHPPFQNNHDLDILDGNILYEVLEKSDGNLQKCLPVWRALCAHNPPPPFGSVWRAVSFLTSSDTWKNSKEAEEMLASVPEKAWPQTVYNLATVGRFASIERCLPFLSPNMFGVVSVKIERFLKNSNNAPHSKEGQAVQSIRSALSKREISDALLDLGGKTPPVRKM